MVHIETQSLGKSRAWMKEVQNMSKSKREARRVVWME